MNIPSTSIRNYILKCVISVLHDKVGKEIIFLFRLRTAVQQMSREKASAVS